MFDLEKYFINVPPEPNLSEVGMLKTFFKERRITYTKIADAIGSTLQRVNSWFNIQDKMTAEWKIKFDALKNMFLEWEKSRGYMFNSPEHISAYRQRPGPPTPKKVAIELPKFKSVPLHDCPYKKDGLNFGLDYNEYDVCDDCHLSVACLRYKKRYESKRGLPK